MANDNNESNIKLAFISVPDYIKSSPRWLTHRRTNRVLYFKQIVYKSEPLLKANAKAPKIDQPSSFANFISL